MERLGEKIGFRDWAERLSGEIGWVDWGEGMDWLERLGRRLGGKIEWKD